MNLDEVFEEFYGSPIPPDWDRDYEVMQNVSINDIKGMMQIAIRQACKEQRELCAEYSYWADVALKGQPELNRQILNAPEPEVK